MGNSQGQAGRVASLVREMGLSDSVHQLGFVETEELVALYRGAHSLGYLGFGPENLPPLEAYALGCPVVASDVPGAREQLGEAALYVSPTDPPGVVAAVRTLEDDVERARRVDAGRARAARFTAHGYVQRVCCPFLDDFEHVRRCWASSRLAAARGAVGAIATTRQQLTAVQRDLDALRVQLGGVESRAVATLAPDSLREAEFTVFSQFGEDGILQFLVQRVPIENEVFVEFGVEDYPASPTRASCSSTTTGAA